MILNLAEIAPIFLGSYNLRDIFNADYFGKILGKVNLVIAVAIGTFKTYRKGFINLCGLGNIT